jgi:hypothetical protein
VGFRGPVPGSGAILVTFDSKFSSYYIVLENHVFTKRNAVTHRPAEGATPSLTDLLPLGGAPKRRCIKNHLFGGIQKKVYKESAFFWGVGMHQQQPKVGGLGGWGGGVRELNH